jgi:hypothetical protein
MVSATNCGGIGSRRDVGDGVIYEECPGPKLDCVFNGMCIALIGFGKRRDLA